jgi:hypothetical protein
MNGGVTHNTQPPLAPAPAVLPPNHAYSMQHLTPEQQQKIQEDLADRERQASALAAAGMVAESVSLTTPTGVSQGLKAPPPLGGVTPQSTFGAGGSGGNPPLTSIDWNLDMGDGVGGQGFDDLDMDFATLFDTESEMNMIGGGGMNMSADATTSTTPSPGPPPNMSAETPNPLNGGNNTAATTSTT